MRFRMCLSIALICTLAGSLCAQNLVQNGTFDDDSAWTVVEHTVPPVTTMDLGYVDDAPALGAAPCLRIASAGNDVSRPIVYQKLTLLAGQEYMVSSAIKILDATPASPSGTWFQIYMSPEEPDPVPEQTIDWNPPYKIFNIDAWGSNIADFIGFDGLFEDGSQSHQVGDGTGLYVPPGEAGTEVDIFLVIKPGQCCRVGSYDVLFDNVSVTSLAVEPLAVPMTSVAPVIDGELDGVWHNVGESRCLIADIVNADSATPESWYDLFATFKVMADADNAYVFIEVQDSVIDYTFSNHQGDGVEIFFDGDNSKGSTYDGVNDTQIRITVDDVELADTDSALSKEGTVFKVLLTDLGYNIEASFPLAVLQIDPGNTFGFEMQINDNDGAGDRETIMRWHSDDNDSWQNASLFGQAQLVSRTVGEMLDVARVAVAPVIDGVMEADWKALPEITGNKYISTVYDPSKQIDFIDARFSFRTGWDDQNIYLFVSVIDDMYYDLTANHTSDGLELFFDADNSKTFEAYDQVDDVQLRINHADLTPADIDISGGTRAPANVTKDNIDFVVVDTAIGYDMEIAIPLADLAIPAANGHVFGFDLFLNDADEDVRDNIRNYWSGENDNWQHAHLFGEAVLVGGEVSLKSCLFISESGTAVPDPRDEILVNYLNTRYAVDIATGDDVKNHLYSADDLKQYDFLFVSESVSSGDTKDLKGAPVPIFYTELWASKWDVTGWVPTNESGTYYGNTTVDETVVKIVDGDHPLSAGFATGTEITIVTDSENASDYLTYSAPQIDYVPIATLAADETKVVVMGVEAGTALYNEENVKDGSLAAAARCAAVGINANANSFLTDDAFKLIQAGIDWILAEGN